MSANAPLSLSRFRLEKELGSGATGTVHEAVLLRSLANLKAGNKIAVKFLHQNLTDDLQSRRRFLREARAGLTARHSNLIRVYAVEEVNLLGRKVLYLVMELVEGKTLRELLNEGGAFAESLVRNVGKQIAAGLQALHEKEIVHLDVKPENVVLTKDGRVVLMDLGFARHVKSISEIEDRSSFAGSLSYASPERIRGGSALDLRSDLYSLGVLLYEIATNHLPFPQKDLAALLHAHLEEAAKAPSTFNPRVSPFLDELILNLLSKEPDKRFKEASHLVQQFEQGERSAWWQEKIRSRRAAPSFQLRHQIPLQERERELHVLQREWNLAQQGELRLVAIEGEEGTGKSRLVDEFATRLRDGELPPLTLYGRSPRLEEPPPCAPFLAALERYLGLPNKVEPSTTELRRLKKLLSPTDATRLYEALRTGQTESENYEDALAGSFANFLDAIAKEGPIILFLDDFSWADHATVHTVEILTQQRKIPLLLLLGVRPEMRVESIDKLLQNSHEKHLLARLHLKNLSQDAVRAIVQSRFNPQANIEEWTQLLFERSSGNPSLLREILSTLQSREVLVEENGKWTPQGSTHDIPIPASITEAVRQRRDLLEPQERGLLECAAVAGARFDVALLAKAFGVDQIEILQGLNRLEQKYGLLVSAGQGFRFTRPVVREVLYHDLDPEVRIEAHRRLAMVLEEQSRGKILASRNAMTLTMHASRGQDHKMVLRIVPPLVEWMYRRGVFDQVHRLAHLALEHLQHLPSSTQLLRKKFDLLSRAAEAEGRLGMRVEEKRDLEECARIANELGDENKKTETYFLLGRYAHTTGKYLMALGFLERAEEHAKKANNSKAEREAILQRASVLSYIGDFTGAEKLFNRIARKSTEEKTQLRAYIGLGKLQVEKGHFDSSLEAFEKASKIENQSKDPVGEILFRLYRGRALSMMGQDKAALVDLNAGIESAHKVGDRRLLCLLEIERGTLLVEKNTPSFTEELFKKVVQISREIGDRYTEALAHLTLAEFLIEHGKHSPETQRIARFALTASQEAEIAELQVRAHIVMAEIYLRQNSREEALTEADSALEILQDNPTPIYLRVFIYYRYQAILKGLGRAEQGGWALERSARMAHAIWNLSKSKKVREYWERKKIVSELLKPEQKTKPAKPGLNLGMQF